jgi:predicted transcriptional regulator YdeE
MRTPFTILSIATALVSSPLLGQNAPHISDKTNFIEENMMGTHEVVQKPAILVIGIDCRTSNSPEAGPQDIPKLWGRFYSEDIISRIPNKTSNEVIALYCDYEGDYTQPYSVVIGCPVSSIDTIPEGMVAKTIPASSYAIFRATGEHPKALIETWGKIWQESNLERTYTGDYEAYNEKFFFKSPQEIDVYVAVQKNANFANANESKFAAINALNLPIDQYAITGSGALGIRNLRAIGDIDIIVTPELWNILAKKYGVTDENNVKKIVFPDGIVEALGERSFYTEKKDRNAPAINDRIASAEVIEGLPFESLEHVLYYKRKMSREKDKQDIEIIESLINEKEKNT